MLRSAKEELRGCSIYAVDGDAGGVEELYFDDESWKVRYMVVKTGGLLVNRQVLISPGTVTKVDRDTSILYTELTREEIKDSPDIEAAPPVAEQQEAPYYGTTPYWGAGWEATQVPVIPTYTGPYEGSPYYVEAQPVEASLEEDPHLRSTRGITGYRIGATDGEVGHVEDFVLDDEEWTIRYVVVDTRNWLPGKKVLLSPDWIAGLNWFQKEVYVDLTRDEIKAAPEWDPETPLDREHESGLYEHYGRTPYWVYR